MGQCPVIETTTTIPITGNDDHKKALFVLNVYLFFFKFFLCNPVFFPEIT